MGADGAFAQNQRIGDGLVRESLGDATGNFLLACSEAAALFPGRLPGREGRGRRLRCQRVLEIVLALRDVGQRGRQRLDHGAGGGNLFDRLARASLRPGQFAL